MHNRKPAREVLSTPLTEEETGIQGGSFARGTKDEAGFTPGLSTLKPVFSAYSPPTPSPNGWVKIVLPFQFPHTLPSSPPTSHPCTVPSSPSTQPSTSAPAMGWSAARLLKDSVIHSDKNGHVPLTEALGLRA